MNASTANANKPLKRPAENLTKKSEIERQRHKIDKKFY
jgi:hypothetical protein